ncbi:FAD-dependent oxidoreductase [Vibrio viridaestus]|uniref:Oxidoreductase n=1 Tax=Vibrio viridaestus TaxID=2487322 RepID=A0A3N9TC16_9VIBR|nr:FAD-dependent oxidoreductase [Vibrio viridaestus]RQW61748.1 oxidoreductase [Vibrio viridaestus]
MTFQRVARVNELEDQKPVRKTVGDTDILLIKLDDSIHACGADCPHKGAPMEKGAVCEGKLVCPWHKAVFDIESADVCEPPALEGLKKYPLEIRNEDIYVDVSQVQPTVESNNDNKEAQQHFVILGSGAAGATALQTLLNNGFKGKVTIVDEEQEAPYDRTLLTKAVPAGKMSTDDVTSLLPAETTEQPQITRLSAAVKHVDAENNTVFLQDGQSLVFDQLLVATGGEPAKPDMPGIELDGIHTLRHVGQVEDLISDIENAKQLTIIGNSFIALEAAASLKQRNDKFDITVVAPDSVPFRHLFGEKIGTYFRQMHEQNGIKFVEGRVTGFTGSNRISGIDLQDGSHLKANLVLMATGIKPETEFLDDFDLEKDATVKVNSYLQAADNVYAAGDITSYPYRNKLVHIEHWRLAQQHGRMAAENMLGMHKKFTSTPFFWTQQYDRKFEYIGYAPDWDDIEMSGAPEDDQFIALFRKSGKVIAALTSGYPELTGKMLMAMDKSGTLDSAQKWLKAA